jgi:hypothetical protein
VNIVDNRPSDGVSKPSVSNERPKNNEITGKVEHLNVLEAVRIIDRVRNVETEVYT